MADGFDIKVDMRDFKAAIHEYAAFDKRTLPEIVTDKLGRLAMFGAKFVRRTDRATVERFKTDKPAMFWRYIEKLYAKSGMRIDKRRRAKGAEINMPYVDKSTGETVRTRKWMHEKRTVGGANARMGVGEYGKKWRELNMIAVRVLRRRAGRIKHLVGLFLKAAHYLGKQVHQSDVGKNSWKTFGIDAARAVPGESGKCRAFFTMPIRAYLRETGEGNRSVRENAKVAMVTSAIERAKREVISDMAQKTRERYQREADRINSRRRAA